MTPSTPTPIRLREVADDDLPIFFEQQQDVEAARMAAFPPRDRDTFTAHWSKIRRDPDVAIRTIVADGQVAGNIVQFDQAGIPLVGYWLGKPYWGRGIATRAVGMFVREIRIRPLYARVAAHNLASIRVLEKCGFVRQDEPAGADDPEPHELLFKLAQ